MDGRFAYSSSANLTGAGIGAKSPRRRNFEAGCFTAEKPQVYRCNAEKMDCPEGYECASGKWVCVEKGTKLDGTVPDGPVVDGPVADAGKDMDDGPVADAGKDLDEVKFFDSALTAGQVKLLHHSAPSCSDEVKNGHEADVDCGGPRCNKCADTKKCDAATDCLSGICNNKVCDKGCKHQPVVKECTKDASGVEWCKVPHGAPPPGPHGWHAVDRMT